MKASRSMRQLLAMLVAVVVTITGCASIPSSGDPVYVDGVDTDTTGGYSITPEGPSEGDSAEEIIRGFIDAGTGLADDYAIAREFLTSSFSDEWDPSTSVLVYDSQPTVKVSDDGSAEVTLSVGATLDEDGHFSEMSENSDVSQKFTLVQEGGEWRIASAPDGISIIRPRFSLIYTQQTLYFYDPSYGYRVPDVRWIANTPAAATRLVQLLLKGPSSWMGQGVVTTAFPEGTTLAVDTISTSSSTTVVPLSSEALSASTEQRQLMLLQLQSTLSGLNSVAKVQISVNDTTVPIEDLGDSAPVLNPSPSAKRLIVDIDGTLSYLSDDGQTEQVEGLATSFTGMDVTDFSIRGSVAVATTSEGLWRATDSEPEAQLLAAGDVEDVSLDPFGYIWAVVDGAVEVWSSDGSEVSPSLAWGGHVLSAKLSRDGTRLVLLVKDGSQVSVLISGVVRDQEDKPSQLIEPLSLAVVDATSQAVAWHSDEAVTVLSTTSEGSTVTLMTIGGESTTKASTTTPATALAAGSGEDSIRLLLTDGSVVAPRGSSWLQVASGVTSIGYSW